MLELAVRSTVILGVAWAAALLLRRASAATRHLVWHAAVVAVVVAPLLAPLTPKLPIPVLHSILTAPQRVAASVAVAPVTSSPETPVQASRPVRAMNPRTESTLVAAMSVTPYVWAIGSAALLLWFGAGWLFSGGAVRRATRAPVTWLVELNDLQERLHIGSEVGLRVVDRVSSPVVVGLLRSTILLPSSAVEWSSDRRRSVLLHELAHVKRRDCRVQALAQVACVLYWFNPLAWKAMVALRAERERACDDEVIRHGTLPSDYAAHLLDIARNLQPTFAPRAALAMARPSELEGRLLDVLATGRARVPDPASRWLVALLIASATGVALSAAPVRDAIPAPLPPQPSRALRQSLLGAVPTFAEQTALSRAQAEAATVIKGSPDPRARERAVLDLAAAASDTTISALSSALDDESEDVREKAALALGLLSTPDVIPPLLDALKDRSSQVREKAAMGLALRRDARSADALIAAIDDPDAQVREKVVMALGTSNDPRAHAVLVRALDDPDGQVREKAVLGLNLLSSGQPDESTSERARGGLRDIVRTLVNLTR